MIIDHVSEFTDALTQYISKSKANIFFRGHSDAENFELKPTLYRKENFFENEHHLYREAILNCPQDFSKCKNTLEQLVKMQHYGIPTRILDITKNALVALYFTCIDNQKADGEVIILEIPNSENCYYDSDRITILANLCKLRSDFKYQVSPNFDYNNEADVKFINKEYFGYLLHHIKEDKPHFFDIIDPSDLSSVFAVQVKLDNPRIIRQSGAFLIFGVDREKKNCPNVPSEWILKPNNEKVIVPASKKHSILKELEILGISKANLFPELDDLADFLKDKYKKL
ncbi:FRG domain-containing protein [Chryseobacterium gallinarum]|uniref:FRG domain-containing protein n=1 Tax=Chryseobacterium gallinarum TaxID=1324352 RepID=UPI00202584DA|nr:FRG domain-containing protein [Chryseobacterium gallinarum]MCL8535590.1 FRG domain-containing protein [Chryseobacterium gallinarum]